MKEIVSICPDKSHFFAFLNGQDFLDEELKKLEAAREQLYQYLEGKLTEQEMLGLVNITGQIWKVANRKKWD